MDRRFTNILLFRVHVFYLIFVNGYVTAQYSLSTSEPFATSNKEIMLTCSIGTTETSPVMVWSRNGVSVVNIRISDCYEGDPGQQLYNLYEYNCSTSNRRYNLIIPSTRINSEANSQWKCGSTAGGSGSNIYTLQFYTSPTGNPVITGYDGSPRFPGNIVPLTCTVNGGIPSATLSWSCKGTPVAGTALGTSIHTVTIDTSYNGQRCTCTASHPTWTVNKEVQSQVFVVHYKPTTNPEVSGYDGSVRYQGDIVTLTCRVSGGLPLATLSWTCDGQQQVATPSNSTTTVTSVLRLILGSGHNGKTCICHGRHTDPSYTPDIPSSTLIVYYPPSAPGLYPLQSTPFPWIEAEQGTLNCVSQPGNPPTTTYQWIRENVVIPGQTGALLTLTSVTKNDNKKSYKCKVSNDYTVYKNVNLVSQPRLLDVEYRPVIDIGTSPAFVTEAGTFERTCTADGNPIPSITWTPNINPFNGATLRLTNVMRNQTGDYTCKAEARSSAHGLLSNQAVLNVIVQYPPSVSAVFSSPSISEGQGVTMVCLAQGVPDQYTYNGWTQIYRNTVIRSSNDFSTISQNKRNLTLSGVSYQDIGTYRCSANNGIPDKDGNTNQDGVKDLDITFSAVFNSSTKFYSELNRTVEIKIPFLSNPFVVKSNISLTKNNIEQKGSDITVAVGNRNLDINFYGKVINVNGQEVIVTLHHFSSKLQGNYTIGVNNYQGGPLSTFVFEVIPSGPPENPKNFGILSKTSNSITVTWLRGFNGGHSQTFVVLYTQKDLNSQTLSSQEIMEEDNRDNYTLRITDLSPLTKYDFWIYSYNIKGNNTHDFKSVTPLAIQTDEVVKDDMGVIIGVVVAILCIIIVLAVIGGIFFIRRRSQGAKRKSDGLVNGNSNANGRGNDAEDEEEDGVRINILYESAGPNFKKNGNAAEAVYSEVNKKKGNKSGVDNPAALYAEVQKKKPPIDPSAVYAEVQKPKKDQKDGGKPKKLLGKGKKGDKKEKTPKVPNKSGEMGMLYENVENVKKDKKGDADKVSGQSTGAIPKTKQRKPKQSGNRNEDGLIYIDLQLESSAPKGNEKPVIHGLENKTDYAEVDFSRRAAPLPPENDENERKESPKEG